MRLANSYPTLLATSSKLKHLFNDLVEVMIAAREYQESHPSTEIGELSHKNHLLSELLRSELNRLYGIDGCRELIEKCQEGALHRLDAFEKSLGKKRTVKFIK